MKSSIIFCNTIYKIGLNVVVGLQLLIYWSDTDFLYY